MPVNPSPSILKKFPAIKQGTSTMQPRGINPSWLSKGFEGISDTILGALGVGPDTQMNKIGAMGAAALPFLGGMKKPIYDEAGRFLAFESPMQEAKPGFSLPSEMMDVSGQRAIPSVPNDTAYNAHVASSKNKLPGHSNLAPSNDTLERMMSRYKK